MFFKRFNVQVILRVMLLFVSTIILTWIFGDERLFFNQLIIGIILVFQIGELIYFINHTNRELTRFFLAIKHSDFSISYKENKLGKSFNELHQSFSEIIDAYKKVKIEKEIQYQFLQKLVNQINIGIISTQGDHVELINPTAEQLLGVSGIKNWKLIQQLVPQIAGDLNSIGEQGRKLLEIKSSEQSRVVAADVSTLTILEKEHKLITLQDINSEIEQKEIEAWHKLIRILTHEIMNSVTPIASLTETMQSLLLLQDGKSKKSSELTDETIKDILFALTTIHKRSDGLLHFIDNYRKLSRVPKPVMETIPIKSFLEYITKLFSVELQNESISLVIKVNPEDLTLLCDPKLLEQVLINLITNSIHALSESREKKIMLSAYFQEDKITIELHDTGAGIPDKELNEIFIPFFSTKKGGSGIGLSLSKQIMSLHGGSIRVSSQPGSGTSFFLHFRHQTKFV